MKEQRVRELQRRFPPEAQPDRGIASVIRTGRSVFHPEVGDVSWVADALGVEHPEILRELGARSYVAVALHGRKGVIGAISFVRGLPGRRYGATDLAVAAGLGQRVGLALENVRLYLAEREAVVARDDFLAIAAHELRTPLQIVTNLLQNAIRYAPGTPIELSVEGDERRARLAVRDQGLGISAHKRARIFDRFEKGGRVAGVAGGARPRPLHHAAGRRGARRHDPPRDRDGNGHGLLRRAAARRRSGGRDAAVTRPIVPVVEDDGDLREVIAEILEQDRFRVVQAAHGAEALDILRGSTELPQVILLDLMMPVMSGMEFRAVQRRDPRLAAIPVVVMSAVTEGELKASALQPAAFLPKPTDREQMLAVLQHCCMAGAGGLQRLTRPA